MGQPSRDDVAAFLRDFKRATLIPGKATVWTRDKNIQGLLDLGISERQRDNYLLALTPECYHRGPVEDDDSARGGFVWMFGIEIHGQQVYIKLKLVTDGPIMRPFCLSFHPATAAMSFPFRE